MAVMSSFLAVVRRWPHSPSFTVTCRAAFAGVQGAFSSVQFAALRFAIRADSRGRTRTALDMALSGWGGSTGRLGGGGVLGG